MVSWHYVSGNRLTQKQPSLMLYNLSSKVTTTELAGWFTRWLKAQNFHQVHRKIYWDVDNEPVPRVAALWIALIVGIACNGILVALTVLAGDWWGFANAMAMVVSVVVRVVLVRQNRAGIDMAVTKHTNNLERRSTKVIVMMDDSKVVTIDAPSSLIGPVFAQNLQVPNSSIYALARWVGWAAFAVHVISIGMASLITQIYTVILVLASTVLTVSKLGCGDWKLRKHIASEMVKQRQIPELGQQGIMGAPCQISSKLKAFCSEYPISYEDSHRGKKEEGEPRKLTERRQGLYVWLNLTDDELDAVKAWNLVPRQYAENDETKKKRSANRETNEKVEPNEKWWQEYWQKRKVFEERHGG